MSSKGTVFYTVNTGKNEIMAIGKEAWIIRKNKTKIQIPDLKTISNNKKTISKNKKIMDSNIMPKIQEGDTIRTGSSSFIRVYSSYKTKKGTELSVTKNLLLGPNSEAVIHGIDSWEKIDKKTKYVGESIKYFQVNKGFFSGGYTNCDEIIKTPIADIKFKGPGGWAVFDLHQGSLYSSPQTTEGSGKKGEIIYINSKTKKSYTVKPGLAQEIIVSGDSIYRKGLTKMDPFFNNMNLKTALINCVTSIDFDPEIIKENYKSMKQSGQNIEDIITGFETIKQMSSEDMLRLASMSGTKLDPEIIKKIKSMPQIIEDMEKKGTLKQLKKAGAMSKAYAEGMGNENIDKMAEVMADAHKKRSEYIKDLEKVLTIIDKPREYGPLHPEFKVA